MRLFSAVNERLKGVNEHFEAFLEKHESKIVGVGALAAMGAVMLHVGTADASALDNTTAVVKFYGMTMITWIFAVFAILFGFGAMWLRDFRIAILAGLALVGTVIVSYLGI